APFGGGLLAKGPDALSTYAYREADPDVLRRVREIEGRCAAFGVPLGAAALRFSMRESRIVSTVVGMSSPERIEQIIGWATWPIPADLWTEIAPFIRTRRT